MNFLEKVKASIYSPELYREIPKQNFGSALKYFLLLILLSSIFSLVTSLDFFFNKFPNAASSFISNTTNIYPKELEITIKDGQVTTNVEEPYFIPMPKGEVYRNTENLFVIDTKTPYSVGQFEKFKTAAWLTKDSIFFVDSENQPVAESIKTQSLAGIDFKLDQEVIKNAFDKTAPWVKFIGPLLFVFSFIGLYLLNLWNLAYILFLALLIWLLSKVFGWGLQYSGSYKVGIYAITAGILMDLLITYTKPWLGFNGFPFMFTLITLAVVTANLWKTKTSKK